MISLVIESSSLLQDKLCDSCRKISHELTHTFRPSQPVPKEDFWRWSYHLGYLHDIAGCVRCPFCRLCVQALLARWPARQSTVEHLIDAHTIDGDRVWCSLHRTQAGRRQLHYRAAQLSVRTNIKLPRGFSLPLNSHGDIVVLEEDLVKLGYESLYHARPVGTTIDLVKTRRWLDHCERSHRVKCDRDPWDHVRILPESMRLIDVNRMCLCRPSARSRYFALSYVWGGVSGLQITKQNHGELTKEGSLSRSEVKLTPLISDAIWLTQALNERYLWVDQLCIIQDDPNDKILQVHQMDLVYSQAVLTIVAACGKNAGAGLQGLSHSPRDRLAKPEVIDGLQLTVPLPTLSHAIGSSRWNTRAWTFQEYQLSRRRLVFTARQVYFHCRRDVMAEDIVCEVQPSFLGFDREDRNHRAFSIDVGPDLTQWQWPFSLVNYAIALELYTARSLSFADDVFAAFLGIERVLQRMTKWTFWNGLPEDIFDYAILWRPKGNLDRRCLTHATSSICSVSWAAWVGAIRFDLTIPELISYVSDFEVCKDDSERKFKRRMCWKPSPNPEIPAGLIFDRSTQSSFFLHAVPSFSDAIRKSRRAIGFKPYISGPHGDDVTTPACHASAETLRFEAITTVFSVSRHPIPQDQTTGERDEDVGPSRSLGSAFDEISTPDDGRRHWVYDTHDPPRRVGTVWRTSEMDRDDFSYDLVQCVVLSQSRCSSRYTTEWQFDPDIGAWSEWCMSNVMLTRPVDNGTGTDVQRRVTIGKVHWAAWRAVARTKTRVVLA